MQTPFAQEAADHGPSINERMNLLAGMVTAAAQSFEFLCERISPVLAPDYPRDTAEQAGAAPLRSPMFHDIDRIHDRLHELVTTIESVSRRVEL